MMFLNPDMHCQCNFCNTVNKLEIILVCLVNIKLLFD